MQRTETELVEQIERANAAYANGTPYLTDEAYHKLWKQLHTLNPNCPALYHTSKDPRLQPGSIRHRRPIFGVTKAFDMTDMKLFLTRFGQEPLTIQPKYDGVGAVLYQTHPADSSMYSLVLFGDGFVGRDISRHLPRIVFTMPDIDQQNVELVIPNNKWISVFGKNPRNTVSGWINGASIPHDGIVHAIPHEAGPLQYQLIPPYDNETLTEALLTIYSEWRDLYPIDGLMIKVTDEEKRLVCTKPDDAYYRWCIAWKPPMQTKWTQVTDITWDVSRNGRIIPVLTYNEVNLCGTSNTRATGNNAKWLISRGIVVGSDILIGKAGEIIPKVIQCVSPPNTKCELPKTCPICYSELEFSGVDLVCTGTNCKAQMIKSLEYFYSIFGVELKTVGPYTIADMLDNLEIIKTLRDHPWALLDPVSFNLLGHINGVLGHKKMKNYIEALESIKGKINEAQFITALGLEGLAYRTVVKLFHMIKGHASYRRKVPSKAINSFAKGIGILARAREELVNFPITPAPMPPKALYCITGELSQTRNDYILWLADQGFQYVNHVAKNTDFLIIGESKGETVKSKKAKEFNIRIIREEDVPGIIKEYTDETES